MQLQRFEEAADSFNGALEQDGRFSSAWRGKALSQLQAGDLSGAAASLKQIGILKADNVDTWIARSVLAARWERYDDALTHLKEAVEIHGEDSRIRLHRANILVEMNRPAQADAEYERVLSDEPDNAVALNNRAIAWHLLEDFDRALSGWDSLLAQDPNDPVVVCNRASTLARAGRSDEAVQSIKSVLDGLPDRGPVLFNIGNMLMKTGRQDDAISAYDEALAFLPNRSDFWYNKGVVLLDMERWTDALQAFNMAYHVELHHSEYWSGATEAQVRIAGSIVIRDEQPPREAGHTLRAQGQALDRSGGAYRPRPMYLILKQQQR